MNWELEDHVCCTKCQWFGYSDELTDEGGHFTLAEAVQGIGYSEEDECCFCPDCGSGSIVEKEE